MIEQIKLENGVSVVLEKMDSVRSVAFGIFIKNGSVNEDEKTNGISHFIEHMLFKGTKTRTSKDIAEEMDLIGGQLNAYTSKEYTCYYSRVLDTHLEKAMDILCDMLFNSKFDQEDIDKEAKVILEEISMYEDSPEDIVFTELQKSIWKDTPLGYSVLGNPENIKNFKKEDFINFLQDRYVAENTVIAIAGSFDRDIVLEKIEKYFSKMKKGNTTEKDNIEKAYIPSKLKIQKDIEQLHLCIGFEGISLKSKYNYAMSLLNVIFGGGMSSILFQNVREKHGLAYSIYSYNSSYINNGLFNIYAGLNPNQYEKTLEIIKYEINNLKEKKISTEQINKTKEQLKSNYIMGLENTSNRMSGLGRSKILLDRIKTTDEIINDVDIISKEDIDFLIENTFNLEKMSIAISGNVKGINL
ncbi:MAG: insulinase family protein [Eubacteriales bacterium]|nr:insulinase family protein [Eubacteriales bacterium]